MRFAETAQQVFSFLEHAGFRLTQSSPVRLQYETDQAFVTIDRDARSGELNVWVGLQPKDGEARDAFSLTDLLSMEGVDVAEARTPFQVYDESKLRPFLDRLAVDTQVHAQLALAGDRMFFRRLDVYRTEQSRRYWRDREVGRIRMEADKAWQKRELGKLIALYSSIEGDLTASEKGKLAYAKQRAKHDPRLP
jgi:hypothetical protein